MENFNQAISNILNRKSVRKFLENKVEEDKIKQILEAAMAAPSAVNNQPWLFFVIDDRGLLDRLANELPYSKMLTTAPLAMVVCGDLELASEGWEQEFWIQDCSAATENILLAVEALGLGAVWTAVYPSEDRVEIVRNILNIPKNLMPLNVIPIGYPAANLHSQKKWDDSKINYNAWTN